MLEIIGISESVKLVVLLMLSCAFFVGIMLMVSVEAFDSFHRALQKEYGLKKKILPQLEGPASHALDLLARKYPFVAGVIISVAAFFLLLLYK